MSNYRSMSNQQSIIGSLQLGCIARRLDVDRKTIRRQTIRRQEHLSQAAKSYFDTTRSAEPIFPISTTGSELGRKSRREAVSAQIREALEMGLSAQRI